MDAAHVIDAAPFVPPSHMPPSYMPAAYMSAPHARYSAPAELEPAASYAQFAGSAGGAASSGAVYADYGAYDPRHYFQFSVAQQRPADRAQLPAADQRSTRPHQSDAGSGAQSDQPASII